MVDGWIAMERGGGRGVVVSLSLSLLLLRLKSKLRRRMKGDCDGGETERERDREREKVAAVGGQNRAWAAEVPIPPYQAVDPPESRSPVQTPSGTHDMLW